MAEDKTAKPESLGDGMKIRKKPEQQDGAGAQAAPEQAAPEQPAPKQAAAPAQPAAEPEQEFDASKLARRVVDPKASAPRKSKPAPEPLTTFGDEVTTDDFAALFEDSDRKAPARRVFDIGDRVSAVISHIDSSCIYADLGGRNEASAPRGQYVNEDGELEVKVGETHEFFVLGFRGGIQLGKHLDASQLGVSVLEDAQASGLPMQGRVVSKNKGGFVVEISGIETFCPISQIDMHHVEEFDIYLNQTFTFKVMEVRDGGKSVVVSRAALLREEADRLRAETMKTLAPDQVIMGTVRSISDFGAFVDLGGVDGLVHISQMSWGNLEKPEDLVKVGQSVEVKILEIEQRDDGKRPRISLSMKQAQEDPWGTVNEKFHVGMSTQGKVVRCAPFGAFVEISPGIDGLVHISEMSWEHVRRAEDVVTVGQTVDVQITDIDILRQRVGLSMKGAANDPWSDIHETFPVGAEVTGHVEKIEDFGVFVNLEGGITALLPRSEMDLGRNENPHSKARLGSDITARVLSVEPERRRMALTLRDAEDIEANPAPAQKDRSGGSRGPKREQSANQGSSQRSYSEASGSFGTLGDFFKKK